MRLRPGLGREANSPSQRSGPSAAVEAGQAWGPKTETAGARGSGGGVDLGMIIMGNTYPGQSSDQSWGRGWCWNSHVLCVLPHVAGMGPPFYLTSTDFQVSPGLRVLRLPHQECDKTSPSLPSLCSQVRAAGSVGHSQHHLSFQKFPYLPRRHPCRVSESHWLPLWSPCTGVLPLPVGLSHHLQPYREHQSGELGVVGCSKCSCAPTTST